MNPGTSTTGSEVCVGSLVAASGFRLRIRSAADRRTSRAASTTAPPSRAIGANLDGPAKPVGQRNSPNGDDNGERTRAPRIQ
jgi:hypothetical protein